MALSDVELKLKYTSICANRHENGIKCLGRYMLFSRANCPILYDLEKNECAGTLLGHNQQVNGQTFVFTTIEDQEAITDCKIISTSYDKTAKVWTFDFKTRSAHMLHSLNSPDDSAFNTRLAIQHNQNIISLTTTIGGAVCLWSDADLIHYSNLKYVPITSQIHNIKIKDVSFCFVFISGTDNLIHLYQLDCDNLKLNHLLDIKGHEDWIKSIEIINLADDRNNEFLVATASQDWYIRVWHMQIFEEISTSPNNHATDKNLTCHLINSKSSDVKRSLLCTLETVLHHGNTVSSLSWFHKQPSSTIQLASCSIDKTVIIWSSTIANKHKEVGCADSSQMDSATDGIWKEAYKFGETSEINLPFLGICVHPLDESLIFVQSLRGAIHCWKLLENSDQCRPDHSITGHSEAVTDLVWEKKGRYLLTCSLDKTTRIHGVSIKDGLWHELARPQVHGHEINCLASINFGKFASGAEEKTIRNYGTTRFFLKSFETLTGLHISEDLLETPSVEQYPKHAQLPALGLSIRGSENPYDDEAGHDGQVKKGAGGQTDSWSGTSKLAEEIAKLDYLIDLPPEEILIQSTLWWETNKLYGHGNEIHALDCNSEGSYMASASRANRSELASVIIWDCTHQFRKASNIDHHSLTITRLKFSPNDKYLLSVSRDRTWCISEKTGNLRQAYKKLIGSSKSNGVHERIIWDCCWTGNSEHFVTVSRDKKAILWSMQELLTEIRSVDQEAGPVFNDILVQKFDQSIQAVEYVPRCVADSHLFVFGLEDGSLELHQVMVASKTWTKIATFPKYHQLTIRRIAITDLGSRKLMATSSDDGVVKVVDLFLK